MHQEGFVFDTEHVRRLKLAFDITLERLDVVPSDHDVRKRLARTLSKIAKRRSADTKPEDLAGAVIDQACTDSAPLVSPILSTEARRSAAPALIPWNLAQRLRMRRDELTTASAAVSARPAATREHGARAPGLDA